MSAAASLAYVAAMQETGVPVTYAYISDAHDFHGAAGNAHLAFGPGSPGLREQLKAYDDAFAAFFQRLAADGIDRRTRSSSSPSTRATTSSAARRPRPAATASHARATGRDQVGEINANIDTLVATQFPSLAAQFLGAGAPNAFTVHGDDAPTFYLAKKGPAAASSARPTRSPASSNGQVPISRRSIPTRASRTISWWRWPTRPEMKLLHMFTTGDPRRNATFTLFGDPNYFLTDFPTSTCQTCINPAFAWNHGDIQPEIATPGSGSSDPGSGSSGGRLASGPTTPTSGRRCSPCSALQDDYRHDGRAILELLHPAPCRRRSRRIGRPSSPSGPPSSSSTPHSASSGWRA